MTPLAARLHNQLTLPIKRRHEMWQEKKTRYLRWALDDVHYFEMSRAIDMVTEVGKLMSRDDKCAPMIFLPAPKTWLEFKFPGAPERMAFLLEETEIAKSGVLEKPLPAAAVTAISAEDLNALGVLLDGQKRMFVNDDAIGRWAPCWFMQKASMVSQKPVDHKDTMCAILCFLQAALVVINSPHIVGRRTVMPHKKLEKALLAERKQVGTFPLGAYTEIHLKINAPAYDHPEADKEGHLTGTKALHFVRKFMRVRFGKLEYVSAHWRGDPALGIKRSRYVVEP